MCGTYYIVLTIGLLGKLKPACVRLLDLWLFKDVFRASAVNTSEFAMLKCVSYLSYACNNCDIVTGNSYLAIRPSPVY